MRKRVGPFQVSDFIVLEINLNDQSNESNLSSVMDFVNICTYVWWNAAALAINSFY